MNVKIVVNEDENFKLVNGEQKITNNIITNNFLSGRDLEIVQAVAIALRDGYERQEVPVIVELTHCGFNLRIGEPLNTSLVIMGAYESDEPKIHVGAYDPSINGKATRAIFNKKDKTSNDVKSNNEKDSQPTLENPKGHSWFNGTSWGIK